MAPRIIYCLVLISALFGCAHWRKVTNEGNKLNLQEISYGPCTIKKLYSESMQASPTGQRLITTDFSLIKQTDKINAQIGQTFGVNYIIDSKETKYIELEHAWILPKTIKDDQGKEFKEVRYTIEKSTNSETFATYTLEKDFELVTGEWIFQVYYKGKKIYERKFYLQ